MTAASTSAKKAAVILTLHRKPNLARTLQRQSHTALADKHVLQWLVRAAPIRYRRADEFAQSRLTAAITSASSLVTVVHVRLALLRSLRCVAVATTGALSPARLPSRTAKRSSATGFVERFGIALGTHAVRNAAH